MGDAAGDAAGPRPEMSDKERQQLRPWIMGKDPRQLGFESGFWTRQMVAGLVQQRMRVSLGLTAVARLLAQ